MISDVDVEKAVDYLRQNARESAQARAEVKYLTEFLDSKAATISKALLEKGGSAASAKLVAKADHEYIELLNGYKAAVENDAFHTFKREAAVAMIDAWRTQQSNARAEGRIG